MRIVTIAPPREPLARGPDIVTAGTIAMLETEATLEIKQLVAEFKVGGDDKHLDFRASMPLQRDAGQSSVEQACVRGLRLRRFDVRTGRLRTRPDRHPRLQRQQQLLDGIDGPLHGQATALLGALGFEHVKVVFEEPPKT